MIYYNVLKGGEKPRGSLKDAGLDLRATEGFMIQPGETVKVPLGVSFEIPPGSFVQLSARSSVALKGVYCHIGTIDASFNGKEVCAIMTNIGDSSEIFLNGERVVQAIGLEHKGFSEKSVDISDEGSKEGFGSTGRI